MEKIRLKPWQKILIFSVAALLILLVIINIILNQKPSESNSLVSVKMNIDLEPTDSTFRVFNEEKTLGDTARFEIISGGDQGWVFQIFAKGKAINYILYIDFRQTEHKWKKGDSLVFVQNIRGIKPNCPLGLFQPKLESKLKINNNSFLYDNLIFWGGVVDGVIEFTYQVTKEENSSGVMFDFLEEYSPDNPKYDEIIKRIENYYNKFSEYWRNEVLNK